PMALCRREAAERSSDGVCVDGAGYCRVAGSGHGRGPAARQSRLVGDARPDHTAHRPARTESVRWVRAGHSPPSAQATAGRVLPVSRRLVSSGAAVLAGVCPGPGAAVAGGRIRHGTGGGPGPGPACAGFRIIAPGPAELSRGDTAGPRALRWRAV